MLERIPLDHIVLTGGFLHDKQQLVKTVTLPALYNSYSKTGRIDASKLTWRQDTPREPHIFWDSDVAKWIEGAAYTILYERNDTLEQAIDAIIADIQAGQTREGYFNASYLTHAPSKRFTKREDHELYCAGHLMEAAVAYYQATGKRALLTVMCRYADLIEQEFMHAQAALPFYTPGHEEIELALVKLSAATGDKRYLTLSKHFIDQRGTRETEQHTFDWYSSAYAQDHQPVRAQTTAKGHAVRALYLYAGMADIARIYQDGPLLAACETLYDDIVKKRLYVTGGLGGNYFGESFSYDYDLPNELAYAETCASIAMVFFAERMFLATGNVKYMDTLEWMLYNNIAAGLSVSGDRFFYTNPLEVHPERRDFFSQIHYGQFAPEYERPEDFSCSCCPPNLIRLYASVAGYMYQSEGDKIYINLYGSSRLTHAGLTLTQTTAYPWDGDIRIGISTETETIKTLCLRVPAWCDAFALAVNGETQAITPENGYVSIERVWHEGDALQLSLPMPVKTLYANPQVHHNAGRVAVTRGPVVYCAEGVDNGPYVSAAIIKRVPSFTWAFEPSLLGGVVKISCDATKPDESDVLNAANAPLYRDTPYPYIDTTLTLVPYAVWANRGRSPMSVWLRREMD